MFRRLTDALRKLWRPPASAPSAPTPTTASPPKLRTRKKVKALTRRQRRASKAPAQQAPRNPTATRARFYDLHDDFQVPSRWELGDPRDANDREVGDVWMFTAGRAVMPPGPLNIPTDPFAQPLDFSLAGAGLTPVLHPRVAELFRALAPADVQLLPTRVEGRRDTYFILVATRLIRCIDEAACEEARRYTPEDGLPEKVGQYRTVRGLRIDPSQVGDAQVFRPWGYPVTLIVSEPLKRALEKAGVSGPRFTSVTGART
ncbi:hypothetical protein KRR26_08210 [Corallococcus sp. M34]|uniref:imm11 family protein n=1 Tax=Citreicoccus inhibens TaxID=2849499 RepID=UPI0018F66F2F|nr:DUF1629 domain-containing protein [Citreicoccus inhibens]MBU8895586.1 hypothetical protein [Citreicoccus inhibens]